MNCTMTNPPSSSTKLGGGGDLMQVSQSQAVSGVVLYTKTEEEEKFLN